MANEIFCKEEYAVLIINNKKIGRIEVKISKEDIPLVSKFTWHLDEGKIGNPSYIATKIKRKYKSMHRLLTNCPEGLQVDHINRDTFDNRRHNLRVCTSFENMQNLGNNTSGKVGVLWIAYRNKWRAYIKKDKKQIHLGYYIDFQDAVRARIKAEKELFNYAA